MLGRMAAIARSAGAVEVGNHDHLLQPAGPLFTPYADPRYERIIEQPPELPGVVIEVAQDHRTRAIPPQLGVGYVTRRFDAFGAGKGGAWATNWSSLLLPPSVDRAAKRPSKQTHHGADALAAPEGRADAVLTGRP